MPRGFQTLQAHEADRVKQANLFIDFTFEQMALSLAAGKAAILESPARSHLWHFEQLKDIRETPAWRRTAYDACMLLGRSAQEAPSNGIKCP